MKFIIIIAVVAFVLFQVTKHKKEKAKSLCFHKPLAFSKFLFTGFVDYSVTVSSSSSSVASVASHSTTLFLPNFALRALTPFATAGAT